MHRLATIAENLIAKVGTWKSINSHPWLSFRIKELGEIAESCDDAMWKALEKNCDACIEIFDFDLVLAHDATQDAAG